MVIDDLIGAVLVGLGGGRSQTQARMSDFQRQQANAARQQATMLHDLQMREFARRAAEGRSDYIDAEFTVLDERPALEHAKLLEDKR